MSSFILTPEQSQVVHTWGEGISVIAGAGSGKTFTLVQKIRSLLEKNPEARFAAVSFTEKSARDLREKLTELSFELRGEGLRGHWVTTIHGLCAHVLKEFPREAGFDGTEVQLTESESAELWQKAIELLWFETLPEAVELGLETCLNRETRGNLVSLLTRVRDLSSLGFFQRFTDQNLIQVATYVMDQYARMKRREGVLDFQDLEDGAKRALSHVGVRNYYRKTFELVLVDEFQDTNPTQSDILTQFCREGFTNLCVVGDPKQSIYRFRDADVTVFEEFCAKLPTKVILNRNYRSVPGVLDFCNLVCEPLFRASDLSYEPLIPTREQKTQAPIIHLPVTSPKDLANFLLAEKDRGADFSEMVLLLRKVRGRSEVWMKTLIESGIPIAIESGGLLWTDPRAREITSLLRFWLFPQDESYGITFLRAPWVAVPDQWIDEWKFKQKISLWDGFLSSEHPLGIKFREKIALKKRPGEILSLLLEDEAMCDSLGTVLLSLWHQCEELSNRGYSRLAVVQELTRRLKEEAREKGVPPPETLGQLRVMTVHGSKGLEFSRVLLIDFQPKVERNAHSPILFWDRKKGAYLIDRDEEGNKDRTNPNVKAWMAWEKEQLLAESKRIFYVALTRAKDQLIFVVPEISEVTEIKVSAEPEGLKAKPKKREKEKSDPLQVDSWRGWIEPSLLKEGCRVSPMPEREKRDRVRLRTQSDVVSPLPGFFVRRPRHSVSELLKLSLCERQYVWGVVEERVEEKTPFFVEETFDESEPREVDLDIPEVSEKRLRAETVSTQKAKLSAREIGTRVHRALEVLDREAIITLAAEVGENTFPVDAILNFLGEEEKIREAGLKSIWNELAFEIPLQTLLGNEACVGAIDRVEFDAVSGIYTVLDYKVLRIPSSDRRLLSRYGFQLRCYAWAVARLVKIPLGKVRAELVVFSGNGVRRVSVPIGEDEFERMTSRASELIQTKVDAPSVGFHCSRCGFLSKCSEGRAFVTDKSLTDSTS